ncbi:MAG: glycosyltransferase, partial [bacterium]
MKKVIHVFPAYKIGGGPISVLRLIENSQDLYKHYVIGLKQDEELYDEFKNKAAKSFNIDITKFTANSTLMLIKAIKEIEPDIVHAHGKGAAFFVFICILINRKRFKFYYTMHGFHKRWKYVKWYLYLFFEKLLSLKTDKHISVSMSEYNYYKLTTRIKEHKLTCIPNGIKVTKELPPEKLAKIVEQHQYNIVSLSRISFQKDLETMLLSFKQIIKKQNVALHIIGGFMEGDIKYKDTINQLIISLGIKDYVFLWGDIKNAGNLIYYFNLYWSTAIFEGLPTAIIESFQNKTIVVATNCQGNIDLVENGKTGFLTNIKDIDSNAKAIVKAINLKNEKKLEIIENAYRVGQKYSIQNCISRIRILYES